MWRRRGQYRPLKAERVAQRPAGRPKPTKLSVCPALVAAIDVGLAIAGRRSRSARLKVDHPDDEMMRISHETIYQSLYVQSRGELRRQLTAQLRTGCSTRRLRGRVEVRGRIVRVVSIAERPPEADDCRVPGALGGRSVGRRRREVRDRDARAAAPQVRDAGSLGGLDLSRFAPRPSSTRSPLSSTAVPGRPSDG